MSESHQILIIGGGAAGLATATSLRKRNSSLDIAVIEPSEKHYYQPGWTMVGAGVFKKEDTCRDMDVVWPSHITRVKDEVVKIDPKKNEVFLSDKSKIGYDILIVAPGLKLDWDAIEGLTDALGSNGVTSNYRYDLAPYTWELVQSMKGKDAIFTQPGMPIKCAGAPQKAMYLSCDHWQKTGQLADMNVSFCNAGPVLFGCATYVPPLMKYVDRYGINLDFCHNLIKIDGATKTAWFKVTKEGEEPKTITRNFDMIHVCPPQRAPDFIMKSPIANDGGWVDVNPETLQHNHFSNIFALGDVTSTSNAKTVAAARKQAPIVAGNVIAYLAGKDVNPLYDGYGSCPLTVEKGKIILAEFGYGGKIMPTFPWDSTKARRSAWLLKKMILPKVYWGAMLKGREWLTKTTKA